MGTGMEEMIYADMRIGEQLVAMEAIMSFTAPSTAPAGWNYIDLGVQFTH